MEITLDNIIYDEIKLARRLQIQKSDLVNRYDFSNFAAFRTIDKFNDGYINIESLNAFYRQQGKYLTEREAIAIIRRIDTDGDAKIGYVEFSDFINYHIAKTYHSSELLYRDQRLRSAERQPRGRELEKSELEEQDARRKRGQTSEKKARVSFA